MLQPEGKLYRSARNNVFLKLWSFGEKILLVLYVLIFMSDLNQLYKK